MSNTDNGTEASGNNGSEGVVICPICTDTIGNAEENSYTNCGHVYHTKCIKKWIENSNICPQCRLENLTLNKLYLNFDDGKHTIKYQKVIKDLTALLDSANELRSVHEQLAVFKEKDINFQQMNIILEQKIKIIDQTKLDLNALQEKLNEKQLIMGSMTRELSVTKDQLKETEASLESTKAELVKSKDELQEAKSNLETSKTELLKTQTELNGKNVLLEKNSAELQKLQNQLKDQVENLSAFFKTVSL